MSKSYDNAYRLIMGEITYEELSVDGWFLLPSNHEDPYVTLEYYESIEDYDRCIKIRDKINNDE